MDRRTARLAVNGRKTQKCFEKQRDYSLRPRRGQFRFQPAPAPAPRRSPRPSGTATPEPLGLRVTHPHRRPRAHAGLDRQQAGLQHPLAGLRAQAFERLQRPHPRFAERIHPQPPQFGHVRAAAEQLAEVAHQAAHVGAGAALHVQAQQRLVAVQQVGGVQQLERVYFHLPRLDLDHLAAASCASAASMVSMLIAGTGRSRNGWPSASSVSVTTPSRATVS